MADGDVFEVQIEVGVGVAANGVVLFDDLPQVPVDERVERIDVMAVQAARFQVLLDQALLVAEHFDHFVGRIARRRRSNTHAYVSVSRWNVRADRGENRKNEAASFSVFKRQTRRAVITVITRRAAGPGARSGRSTDRWRCRGSSRGPDAETAIEPAKPEMRFRKFPVVLENRFFNNAQTLFRSVKISIRLTLPPHRPSRNDRSACFLLIIHFSLQSR